VAERRKVSANVTRTRLMAPELGLSACPNVITNRIGLSEEPADLELVQELIETRALRNCGVKAHKRDHHNGRWGQPLIECKRLPASVRAKEN
jgi:hypothetical protein